MLITDLKYKIIRYKKSYDFQYSNAIIKKYQFSKYRANTKNNMLDDYYLYEYDDLIFHCKIQTVANNPDFYFDDTIREGKFQLKMFVDPRKYKTDIHGIINAYDLENQPINEKSIQWDEEHWKGRFLRHATPYKFAYSGACFVSSTIDMKEENRLLKAIGVQKDDIIYGILEEK